MSGSPKANDEYVLGTNDDERTRLGLQHHLWREEAFKIWQDAGFRSGQALLDLGCGPGFTTADLASFVGPKSEVHAVDISAEFIDHLNRTTPSAARAPIRAFRSPLESLELPRKDYDGAYCRWLFSFVEDPDRALQSAARHLRPGARFALQEYVAYENMTLCPEDPVVSEVVQAIFKSWRSRKGEPNIARVLPQKLEQVGFRILKLEAITRVARPFDPLWQWPDSFYRNFLPRLQETGFLSADQVERFFRAWERTAKSASGFFLAPSVMNIVAEKV